MWLIEKIKAWQDRRIERKIKRFERKYGLWYFHAQMGAGREAEYPFSKNRLLTNFLLEKERQLRKELENDPKLCAALACMQEQRRQQEILNDATEAFEKLRKACHHKTYGDVCPVLYRPHYDTSKMEEIFENDVLERDKNAREAMKAVVSLEGNKYKTCMQLSSAFQEERRKLGLEALLEGRRISAEVHNPEGVSFYDVQRPEGYSSNFGGFPLGNIGPQYDTSKIKEIYENDVLGNDK